MSLGALENEVLGQLDDLDSEPGPVTSCLCDRREITKLCCVAQLYHLQNEKNATCLKSLRDW